jgi:hypothetical protein
MWVGGDVSITPRPLYPPRKTHCTEGWVAPPPFRSGLDGWGKSRPHTGIRSQDRPAHSVVPILTELSRPAGRAHHRDLWKHTTLTRDIHALGGIRNRDPRNKAASDLRLRRGDHRDLCQFGLPERKRRSSMISGRKAGVRIMISWAGCWFVA